MASKLNIGESSHANSNSKHRLAELHAKLLSFCNLLAKEGEQFVSSLQLLNAMS